MIFIKVGEKEPIEILSGDDPFEIVVKNVLTELYGECEYESE